jgi:hypothetical protein
MVTRELGSEGLVCDNGEDPQFGKSFMSCLSTRKAVADG